MEQLLGGSLNAEDDAIPMESSPLGERLEYKQVEVSLKVVLCNITSLYFLVCSILERDV